MEFFNNKENNLLKFKINSEGIDVNNIETRLVFKTNENNNYLIFGKIVDNICEFEVPELKVYETNDKGNIRFEIISGDTYFDVWSDKFDIKTKINITLEKVEEEIEKVIKPTIESVAPEVVERVDETKSRVNPLKKDKKVKNDAIETHVVNLVKESKKVEKINETKDEDTTINDSGIFTFDKFMTK